jgi:hypothetical protein
MMKETDDKIVMIATGELDPHDYAERFWPEGEDVANDREAIFRSVAEMGGVENPLLVTPKEVGKGYWVVDGCARLQGAILAHQPAVKCRVRAMTLEEIQDTVFINNMVRRRFSAGQRVMRYLENHVNEVLKTARQNADHADNGAKGGRGNKGTGSDSGFSSKAIASRIGTSSKDVLAGVELLRCKVEGLMVETGSRERRLVPAKGDAERDLIGNIYARVVKGETPIRRWVGAKIGKEKTDGQGKAPTDYQKVSENALTKLNTTFGNWQRMTFAHREAFVRYLGETLDAAPEDVTAMLIQRYAPKATAKKAK